MIFEYLLFWFLVFEYFFILAVIAFIVLYKIFCLAIERKKKQVEENLKRLIKDLLTKERNIQDVDRKEILIAPNLLTATLELFDQRFEGEEWLKIKSFFCNQILLPIARHHYKSFFWSRRIRAAQIFLLEFREPDFHCIFRLLGDSDFFIRMLAVSILAKAPTYSNIEKLLLAMAKEAPPARFPYRHSILKMPLSSLLYVVEIYKKSEREDVRLACLDILSRKFFVNFYPDLSKDYKSKNVQIRVFVVKALGNLFSAQSINDLIGFLDDPADEVKIEAIRTLGKIRSENSFEKLTSLLNDSNGDVRIETAVALKKFGKKGRQFLEMQDWDLEPRAYEAARYVLTLP